MSYISNAAQFLSDGCAQISKSSYPYNQACHDDKPLMIIGCGRSGSTLLRAMLMSGQDIAIPPESYVWGAVARRFMFWRFLSWERLCDKVLDKFVTFQEFHTWGMDATPLYQRAYDLPETKRDLYNIINLLYTAYAAQSDQGMTRWGDKTPLNTRSLSEISRIVPHAQYVHLVRDPRAVALSYVRAAQGNKMIKEATIEDAAQRWVCAERSIAAFKQQLNAQNYLQVRFEDLLTRPQETLRGVCDFLSLTYSDEMVERDKSAVLGLGDVELYKHHDRALREIDPERVNEWSKHISVAQQKSIEKITLQYAQQYAYF